MKDSGNVVIAEYDYDAIRRRVEETHGNETKELYYSSQWQVLEERDAATGNTTTQNVWSPVYVDAMIVRRRDTDNNGSLDEFLWVQQDANWNVTSLISMFGAVVERYAYDAYGSVTIYSADYANVRTTSSYAWQYEFQGLKFDSTTGLYHARNRDLSPTLGRPIQSDPLGLKPDVNSYRWENGNPVKFLDPSGLQIFPPAPRAKTETEYRSDLIAELERWRGKGWGYAADLMQHFLDNSGADHHVTDENPNNANAISQIRGEAHSALKQFIGHHLATHPEIKKEHGEKFTISKTDLRFYPSFLESQSGNIHAITKRSDTQFENNHLFYAWYGVRVEIEGTILFDVKMKTRFPDNPHVLVDYLSKCQYSVSAKIKFTDHYDFPAGLRNLHPLISSARNLVLMGYREFEVIAKYSDIFSPFVKS